MTVVVDEGVEEQSNQRVRQERCRVEHGQRPLMRGQPFHWYHWRKDGRQRKEEAEGHL